MICSIEGCERPKRSRGWCRMHYQRWHKYGDPLTLMVKREARPSGLSLEEAFHWYMPGNPPADECWLWPDWADAIDGYGRLMWRGKWYMAHRLAYVLYRGETDAEDMRHVVCHTPRCCNPWHLEPGTHAENMADMVDARRQAYGVRRPEAKLTDEIVLEARRRREAGETYEALAREYGVHRTTIKNAITGKKWKHLRRAGSAS